MCQNVTMTNYEEIDQYVSNLEEYKVQMLLSFLKKQMSSTPFDK